MIQVCFKKGVYTHAQKNKHRNSYTSNARIRDVFFFQFTFYLFSSTNTHYLSVYQRPLPSSHKSEPSDRITQLLTTLPNQCHHKQLNGGHLPVKTATREVVAPKQEPTKPPPSDRSPDGRGTSQVASPPKRRAGGAGRG